MDYFYLLFPGYVDNNYQNIVIDAYDRPKILNFGLAAIRGGEQITKTGSTLGTIRYMSLEQVEGKKIDRKLTFGKGVSLWVLKNTKAFQEDVLCNMCRWEWVRLVLD